MYAKNLYRIRSWPSGKGGDSRSQRVEAVSSNHATGYSMDNCLHFFVAAFLYSSLTDLRRYLEAYIIK